MINTASSYGPATQTEYPTAQSGLALTAQDVRMGFEDFIRVNFNETGFLSQAEMLDQRQYVERVLATASPESSEFQDLVSAYTGAFAEQSKAKNLSMYSNDVVAPLKNALDSHAISASSYREWIEWIRDPKRTSAEKKASIAKTLPEYLGVRRELASKRAAVIGDKRMQLLQNSPLAEHKALVAKITDDDFFLEKLSLKERKDCVVDVLNAFPVVEGEKDLFAAFQKDLEKAKNEGLISGKSVKKWVARFQDPRTHPTAKAYFVNQQFPSYMEGWRAVTKKRTDLMASPLFSELKESDVKGLSDFKDDKKFIELHFDKKSNLCQLVENAIKAKKTGNEAWHGEVSSLLQAAAASGYISADRTGELLQNMQLAGRSVKEVRGFIKTWAKDRFRFDQVHGRMAAGKVPQGLTRLSEQQFLMLKWEQRQSYIEEAERRLNVEERHKGGAFQDRAGKVRHALDTEQWDEARMFLKEAWATAESEEDMAEIRSMEKYLKNFGEESADDGNEDKRQKMLAAVQKIDAAMHEMPDEAMPFYREVFKKEDPNDVRCLGVLLYNVEWCLQRGYLPRDLGKAEEKAKYDTRSRLEPAGPKHIDGALEFNDVSEHGSSAIPEDRWGPNVMCTTSSEASKMADSIHRNKNDFAYWYWGDLVIHGISSGQYARLGTVTRKAITSASYALAAMGESYLSAKEKLGLDQFSAN